MVVELSNEGLEFYICLKIEDEALSGALKTETLIKSQSLKG